MIISASRRTDIPAFYGDWFLNRLQAGEVVVRNPLNPRQLTRVPLSLENVDCIVFWTKNPAPFLKALEEIDRLGYKYYFLFTINPYGHDMEAGLPCKQYITGIFKRLSDRTGAYRVVWRYDPVIITGLYNEDWHYREFDKLSRSLCGHTRRCIISFVNIYKKIEKTMIQAGFQKPGIDLIQRMTQQFGAMAKANEIELYSCAPGLDYSECAVKPAKCIDGLLIKQITGREITAGKDMSQRKDCGCVKSKDIGAYNTCIHQCLYCYANINKERALFNHKNHNPASPILCDNLDSNSVIGECSGFQQSKAREEGQNLLFDS